MGGAWYSDVVGDMTSDQVGDMAVDQVARVLGITRSPVRCHTSLLPQCIAQYTVGHLARVARVRSLIQSHKIPLHIVGSSYDGPGINDTIMSAKRSVII